MLKLERRLDSPSALRIVATVDGQHLLSPAAESFLEHVDFAEEDPRWAQRVYPLAKSRQW